MKIPLIVSLVALVLSLIGLGAVLMNAPADSKEAAAVLPASAGSTSDLRLRLDALAEENRELRDRLAFLESQPVSEQRAPAAGTVSMDVFEAFRDEMRGALARKTSLPATATVETPEFRSQLAEVLDELQKAQAVEDVRAGQQKRRDQLDQTVAKLEDWLELTPHQADSMRTTLEAQYEREAELVRRWEAGEDDEVLGEEKGNMHATFQQELSQFLSTEQFERYTTGRGRGK